MPEKPDTIFIPGNVPSSKNSKNLVRNPKTGRPFLVWSSTAKRYRKSSKRSFEQNRAKFLLLLRKQEPPYQVRLTFIRDTKRKFDYVNPAQTILDLMVEHKWIDDDNCTIIKPSFGDYSIDKKRPGVRITVLCN